MRFFIINLDRATDRLAYMTAELQKRGFEPERIPACLGLDIPDDLKPYLLADGGTIPSAMNKGEIGCYASHLVAINRVLEEDITEPVCIMEDDLRFEDNFAQLPEAMKHMPPDWEFLRVSNPTKAACSSLKDIPGLGQVVKYWRVPNTAGAYILNQEGARKFLTYRTLRMRPIDEDFRRPWETGMVTYGILPSPTIANIFDSSIDAIGGDRSEPGRKRFKNAGGSLGKEWAYRLREFGFLGCITAMITTLISKKRIMARWNKSQI